MNTVNEYNVVFERAKKRLIKSASNLTLDQVKEIAKECGVSFQSLYDYCRRGLGTHLKTTLEYQEAILKYNDKLKA